MKKMIFIFASLVLVMSDVMVFGQPVSSALPNGAALMHYKLAVGYTTTTVLIFPAAIKQVDRGERELLAQKQPGVENVLKVKAGRKDFAPTNLHVFTADGRVYAFDVRYAVGMVETTYDLGKLDGVRSLDTVMRADAGRKGDVGRMADPGGVTDFGGNAHAFRIKFSNNSLDTAALARKIVQVKAARPFFSTHSSKDKMTVQLQTIYWSGSMLFLGLQLTNRSGLPFAVDFAKLYIRDRKRMKRSSVQEREVIPVYRDTVSAIAAFSAVQWVVVIPQLTVPEGRELVWEMRERNGGRGMRLKVRNREVFRARGMDLW